MWEHSALLWQFCQNSKKCNFLQRKLGSQELLVWETLFIKPVAVSEPLYKRSERGAYF
jgi:hypothetical protein